MIRLLCVGLGGMGRHDWNAALACSRFAAVGGVDPAPAARATFAERTGAPVFTDLGQALGAAAADAALIATPDAFHAPFTLQALEAGLDVICEKPLAERLEDARRMHAAARRHGRLLMVHHQLRWHPAHHTARRLLAAGAIGDLRRLDMRFAVHSDVCLRGYRSRLPHMVLQDLTIHHFDLIRHLSAQECQRLWVRDWPSPEPNLGITAATDAVALVEMTGPVTVSYTAATRELIEPVGYVCRVRLYGSGGELVVEDGRLTLQTHGDHAAGTAPRVVEPEAPELDPWAAFAQAMETRAPTLTDSGDNLRSLAMLFAAIESAETGRIVEPAAV